MGERIEMLPLPTQKNDVVEHLFFDCDGVIVDSEILSTHAFIAALAPYGYRAEVLEHSRRFAGMLHRDVVAAIADELDTVPESDIFRQVDKHFEALFADSLTPVAGMPELLLHLGVMCSVVSNSHPEHIKHALGRAGLGANEPFGDRVYSANHVSRPKPFPDIYQYAMRQNDLLPPQCLVVEDSTTGVRAAVAAGISVIGFCGASHITDGHAERLVSVGATYIARNATELGQLLSRLIS